MASPKRKPPVKRTKSGKGSRRINPVPKLKPIETIKGIRISQAKLEEMFSVFATGASIGQVVTACKVHRTTVQKYHDLLNWEERRAGLIRKANEKQDNRIIDRTKRNLDVLDKAITNASTLIEGGYPVDPKQLSSLIKTQDDMLSRLEKNDELSESMLKLIKIATTVDEPLLKELIAFAQLSDEEKAARARSRSAILGIDPEPATK